MADDVDTANDLAAQQVEASLQSRTRYAGKSHTHCMDCGDEIPEPRRQSIAGVCTCVHCAEVRELKGRRL